MANHLILYDGVCVLCNWFVAFVLARDRRGVFGYASLQGESGRAIVASHGWKEAEFASVLVVRDRGGDAEAILSKSAAVFFVLHQLRTPWRVLLALEALPDRLLDWGYGVAARHRYRVFGKHDVCPMPPAEFGDRFLR